MWHLKKIPKSAHFYWGNDKISFLRYLTVLTFRKFNPDWRIKLYYPKNRYKGENTWVSPEHSYQYSGENYLEKLLAQNVEIVEVDLSRYGIDEGMPESFKSDLFRWNILSTEGGLWSDMDIVFFRPMESLYLNDELNKHVDTAVCIKESDPSYHSIGFLMASSDNLFYRFIHDLSHSNLDLQTYQSIGSHLLMNYAPTISSIRDRFPDINVVNLKMDTVYPLHDYNVSMIYESSSLDWLSEETIGLHWYAGHPLSGRWENTLTESNFRNYTNVLAQLIARVL